MWQDNSRVSDSISPRSNTCRTICLKVQKPESCHHSTWKRHEIPSQRFVRQSSIMQIHQFTFEGKPYISSSKSSTSRPFALMNSWPLVSFRFTDTMEGHGPCTVSPIQSHTWALPCSYNFIFGSRPTRPYTSPPIASTQSHY